MPSGDWTGTVFHQTEVVAPTLQAAQICQLSSMISGVSQPGYVVFVDRLTTLVAQTFQARLAHRDMILVQVELNRLDIVGLVVDILDQLYATFNHHTILHTSHTVLGSVLPLPTNTTLGV